MLKRRNIVGAAVLFLLALLLVVGLNYVGQVQQTDVASPTTPNTTNTDQQAAYIDVSEALFNRDVQAQQLLAQKVVADIEAGITVDTFDTGSARYNAEWAAGSYQMAVLGLGQILWTHPSLKETYLPVMEQAIERLLTPEINQFGTEAWGEDGQAVLRANGERNLGHAYLGYTNLALSMLRSHKPDNRFAAINDQLTAAFLQQLTSHPSGMIETYPNEAYPADISAVIASVALHAFATKAERNESIENLSQSFFQQFVDTETGMVFQSIDKTTGSPTDRPRASGTALSAYYLSFANTDIAAKIFQAISQSQVLPLPIGTAIREYPAGETGDGDIDSGTIFMEASPSATAFSIGGAMLVGDEVLYRKLYETVLLFSENSVLSSALLQGNANNLLESPLGHSILLAMLTANSSNP